MLKDHGNGNGKLCMIEESQTEEDREHTPIRDRGPEGSGDALDRPGRELGVESKATLQMRENCGIAHQQRVEGSDLRAP